MPIQKIEALIESEKRFIETKKDEVTVDFAIIKSGIKIEAYETVKKLLEKPND